MNSAPATSAAQILRSVAACHPVARSALGRLRTPSIPVVIASNESHGSTVFMPLSNTPFRWTICCTRQNSGGISPRLRCWLNSWLNVLQQAWPAMQLNGLTAQGRTPCWHCRCMPGACVNAATTRQAGWQKPVRKPVAYLCSAQDSSGNAIRKHNPACKVTNADETCAELSLRHLLHRTSRRGTLQSSMMS